MNEPWTHSLIGYRQKESRMTVGPLWYCMRLSREWHKDGYRCTIKKLKLPITGIDELPESA